MTSEIWGFFYGGLIKPEIRRDVGLAARDETVATVSDFALTFEPYVNLTPSAGELVYGLLMRVAHQSLQQAYGRLKAVYLPWPVLARTLDGVYVPALCYIAADMAAGPVEAAHVRNLIEPAEALGFPAWYVDKIRRFLPASE